MPGIPYLLLEHIEHSHQYQRRCDTRISRAATPLASTCGRTCSPRACSRASASSTQERHQRSPNPPVPHQRSLFRLVVDGVTWYDDGRPQGGRLRSPLSVCSLKTPVDDRSRRNGLEGPREGPLRSCVSSALTHSSSFNELSVTVASLLYFYVLLPTPHQSH